MRKKLFTKAIDTMLFKQYAYGSDLEKQKVAAKIFNPYGRGRWYILNSDPQDPDYLWAIVEMGDEIEIGSVSREDLETMKVPPFRLNLERDLYFTPTNAKEVYDGLRRGQFFAKGGDTGVELVENKTNEYYLTPEDAKPDTMAIKLGKGGSITLPVSKSISEKDINEFVEYVEGFYGKKGIYADDLNGGFTKKEIKEAVMKYISDLDKNPTWGYGDSLDRERVRQYLDPEYSLLEKGGNIESYKLFDFNEKGNLSALINDKYYEVIYRDDISQLYDLFEDNVLIKSSEYVRDLLMYPEPPKVIRTQFEEEEFEFAQGGMLNRELNLYAKKRAEALGVTPQNMKSDYELALKQALIAGLTDANYHSSAKKLVSMFEGEEWSESLWNSIYWDADNSVRELGINVAKESEYDGYDVAMAFKYIAQMTGYQKLAGQIDNVMSETMAKGGKTKKFVVDDVVYNKRTKTIGIVRLEDERGETKTDADGNVNTSELEHYNPIKYPHQSDGKVAPSTEKEINSRGLWQPFKKMAKGGYMENGGNIINGYVVYFSLFRSGKKIPVITNYFENKEEAEQFVLDKKSKKEKGYNFKEASKMPTYSEIRISSSNENYKKVKGFIHSKEKVEEFFNGKDSFYKKNYAWVLPYGYKWDNWQLTNEKMAKGGKTKFMDKVKSIQSSLLKRKKVSPSVQKDYGKTYSKSEALDSAKRIAGSMRAEEMSKKKG